MAIVRLGGAGLAYAGGGYFRLSPYWISKRLVANADYSISYFHPRDIDPDQPMIGSLPLMRRFKSYYGLKGCLDKLDRLLSDFRFETVGSADKLLAWDRQPVVNP